MKTENLQTASICADTNPKNPAVVEKLAAELTLSECPNNNIRGSILCNNECRVKNVFHRVIS